MEDRCIKQEYYKSQKDDCVISAIRLGDQEAQDYILNKYKAMVKAKARAYFLVGADREDIIQEGMIGLYKAIRDYQADKNASFRVFAELCINRQIITAIKAATRQKHIPLNSYISLNKPVSEEKSQQTYLDVIQEGTILNPEMLLIGQEDKNYMETQMGKTLSDFETRVLMLYLQGMSYTEIAVIINKPEKSIDNALQRVKKKIEKFMSEKTS